MDILNLRRDSWDNMGRRRTNRMWNRVDPLNHFHEIEFLREYRLTKSSAIELAEMLEPDLKPKAKRSDPLTPLQQVCLTLSFLANGSFMHLQSTIAGVKKYCAFKVSI